LSQPGPFSARTVQSRLMMSMPNGASRRSPRVAGQISMIGTAEPLRPDTSRFNKKGLFGIILKAPDFVDHRN